jgi:transmembrane sensor
VLALAEPGATLALNTSTLVDVDAAQHRAKLYEGEVLLSLPSPAAGAGVAADWQVQAGAALVQPLGRKVALSLWDGVWRVAALDGAVRLRPVAGAAAPADLPDTLDPGRAVQWTAHRAQTPGLVSPNDELWTQGLLLADAMPLGELLRRFGRHHRAVLRCDPAVAQLAISGLYQLNDLPRMLHFVAARYPVAVRRVTDYWITLERA